MSTAVLNPPLTAREQEIARMTMDGLKAREIAEHLGWAEGTVKNAKHVIFAKLDVKNAAEMTSCLRIAEPASMGCVEGQMWACLECGEYRQWGICQPYDAKLKPALGCKNCQTIVRHTYAGLIR